MALESVPFDSLQIKSNKKMEKRTITNFTLRRPFPDHHQPPEPPGLTMSDIPPTGLVFGCISIHKLHGARYSAIPEALLQCFAKNAPMSDFAADRID
jgi:hypothetical protein